jgi:hypothetical protein
MISTMVEYLQGIQVAKEAIAPEKNGLGNPANNDEYFTRADDIYEICYVLKYPMEVVLLAITHQQIIGLAMIYI